jgi:hypothetical protein
MFPRDGPEFGLCEKEEWNDHACNGDSIHSGGLHSAMSRDADRTVYGYGRTFDGEHTASGRTVTYPYLHVKNHLTVRYGDYYGRHTGQDGVR